MDHPPGDQPASTQQFVRDCVLYLRKSKGKASIPRQRREGRALADRLRWRIVAEFVDIDSTAYARPGAPLAVRDDYGQMLEALRADTRSEPLGIIAWHADRINRNPVEVEDFIVVCAEGRHPVETCRSGNYELWTATGRKRIRSDGVDAAYEVDHLIERLESDREEKVRLGKWLGGPVPFGWEYKRLDIDDDEKALVLHPQQADAIRWACQEVLRKRSLLSIAAEWNRRGLRRRKGGLFDGAEVRRILLRPRNAGLMSHKGEIKETELPGGLADWPPIVPVEVWEAVRAVLLAPGRGGGNSTRPKWLGSSLYRCGVCGATVKTSTSSGSKDGKRRVVVAYRCRSGKRGHVVRSAAPVDEYVEMVLLQRMSRRDFLELIAVEPPPDIEGMQARLLVQEQELATWRQLAEAGEVTAVAFAKAEKGLLRRIAEIKREISAAVASPLLSELVTVDDVRAYYLEQDLEWRRALIDLLMTVTIHKVRPGRPKGHWHGESYFKPEGIQIDWKTVRRASVVS